MCTAVVSIDPQARFPVLLAGIRDEFHDRAWEPPARHWPDRPELIGGRDKLAGGTWLAVHPGARRVGVVLNGRGALASERTRLSRGDLPLRFAQDGALEGLEYERYDPFHLVCASLSEVRLLSWNGERAAEQVLEPGLHVVVNSGLEGADPTDGPGTVEMNARIAYFRPRLADTARPEPADGPAATAWGGWLPLVDGAGLTREDPRALVLSRDFGGRVWGTTSISLVGLAPDAVRYDFSAVPGDPQAWTTVLKAE